MARKFTTKQIESMKPETGKRVEVPDPGMTGLYLVMQATGAKSWAVRYRHEGKPKKLTLGRWPIMGLADAREAAGKALEAAELGGDPAAEKQAEKANRMEALLSERDKIKTLIAEYDRRQLSSLKTRKQIMGAFNLYIIPVWGEREIQTIKRRDVITVLDEIIEDGHNTTANRLLSYLNTFFNWCMKRDVIEASPTAAIDPQKEKRRTRFLNDDEIRWFWAACEDAGSPWGTLGKLLLLTGQRRGEVARMTAGEINGDVWHLSSERTKNGQPHDVPLSPAVLEILAELGRPNDPDTYMLTTIDRAAISGFSKGKARIAEKMEEIAGQEIPGWTWHDLRRTAATIMARLGTPVRVTEAALNHISGTGGGIVSVYQQHEYATEKREALQQLAKHVQDVTTRKD